MADNQELEEGVDIGGEGDEGVGEEGIEKDEKELEALTERLASIEEESKKMEEMFEQVASESGAVDKEEQDARSGT